MVSDSVSMSLCVGQLMKSSVLGTPWLHVGASADGGPGRARRQVPRDLGAAHADLAGAAGAQGRARAERSGRP